MSYHIACCPDLTTLHLSGVNKETMKEISDRIHQVIETKATNLDGNTGVISFDPIEDDNTKEKLRLILELEFRIGQTTLIQHFN